MRTCKNTTSILSHQITGQKRYRIKWMDLAKSFTIFLVIWGHSIQYFRSQNYELELSYRIIYSFHMPLFMIMCGYFFPTRTHKSIPSLLLQRFKALILPCLSWSLIFALVRLCFNKFGSDIIGCFTDSFSLFWFLKSAFVCYAFAIVSWKIYPVRAVRRSMILITLVLSQFINLWQLNYMYPCFLLGVFMSSNDNIYI